MVHVLSELYSPFLKGGYSAFIASEVTFAHIITPLNTHLMYSDVKH